MVPGSNCIVSDIFLRIIRL